MKCFIIVLLIVLIKIEFVRSFMEHLSSDYKHPSYPDAKEKKCHEKDGYILRPKYEVYLMGSTIVLLFLIVLCLLAIIYRLKCKVYSESISDNVRITETDCATKYSRQLSSEKTEITYTRENSNEENRFKLLRQGSKMTIADYPINYVNNEKKSAETSTTTNHQPIGTPKVSKVLNTHIGQMQQEQIKRICEGVLQKTQRLTEANSLSNLDNILNESTRCNDTGNEEIIEKSASSPFLDVADNFKDLGSPLLAKKVTPSPSSAKKLFPSPTSVKKLQEFSNSTIKGSDDSSAQKERKYLPLHLPAINHKTDDSSSLLKDDIHDNPKSNCTLKSSDDPSAQKERKYLPLRLPPINHNKTNDASSLLTDDIYDNPPKNNTHVLSNDCDDKNDDVYDNPPTINRPVKHTNDGNELTDDVYDNPPCINRLVFQNNAHDEDLLDIYDKPPNTNRPTDDDVYDNLPSNRPVTAYDDNLDNIYDDLRSDKPAHNKDLDSLLTKKLSKNGDLSDYDRPQTSGRGIRIDDDNDTGYLLALTDQKESCFDACYSNAKSLKK